MRAGVEVGARTAVGVRPRGDDARPPPPRESAGAGRGAREKETESEHFLGSDERVPALRNLGHGVLLSIRGNTHPVLGQPKDTGAKHTPNNTTCHPASQSQSLPVPKSPSLLSSCPSMAW